MNIHNSRLGLTNYASIILSIIGAEKHKRIIMLA